MVELFAIALIFIQMYLTVIGINKMYFEPARNKAEDEQKYQHGLIMFLVGSLFGIAALMILEATGSSL